MLKVLHIAAFTYSISSLLLLSSPVRVVANKINGPVIYTDPVISFPIRWNKLDKAETHTWYLDNDGDGFGDPLVSVLNRQQPLNYVSSNTDCNDANSAINPSMTEICNGLDDDCSGQADDLVVTNEISLLWEKSLGGSKNDQAIAMDYCSDGGFIIAGYTESTDGDVTINRGKKRLLGREV
jgi:hypothetical protein